MFPPGNLMYAGLTSTFNDICIFGKEGGAERDTYAQFLEEAGVLLSQPELTDAADKFRTSAEAWNDLAKTLLPDSVELFKETRLLMLAKHNLFLEKGSSALGEIRQINDQLEEIKFKVGEDFPLNSGQSDEMKGSIAEKVLTIRDIEFNAIQDLQKAAG